MRTLAHDRGSVSVEHALLMMFLAAVAAAGLAVLGDAVAGLFLVPEIDAPANGPH